MTKSPLSLREEQVLSLTREGHTQKEIALILLLSVNTIKIHMRTSLAKLQAKMLPKPLLRLLERVISA